jgi:hypothetical protein
MKVSRPQDIRKLISREFALLTGRKVEAPRESVLIKNGYYCGHRFESEEFQAVWFLEEDQIKFFGRDGSLVHVLCPASVAIERSDSAPAKAA